MSTAAVCRVLGGVFVILVGAAVGGAGLQLWRGGPEAWPDVIADQTTVRRTAGGMILMGLLLLVSGAAATGNVSWAGAAAALATILVVLAAFWVNDLLFGSMRPLHTVTNVVLAAIILALLWLGYSGRSG